MKVKVSESFPAAILMNVIEMNRAGWVVKDYQKSISLNQLDTILRRTHFFRDTIRTGKFSGYDVPLSILTMEPNGGTLVRKFEYTLGRP